MSQASFILQMIDRVTGPARAAVAALRQVQQAAGGVQAQQQRADAGGRGMARAMREQKKEAGDLGGTLGALKGRLLGFAAAVGATKLASDAVGGVFDAQRFKEDSEQALAVLLRSGEEAKRTMGKARKIAGDLALDPKDTIKGFVELVGKGFSVSEIERITKSMADLKVVSPDVDPSRILGGLSKIKATGYLQGDELNILVEAGVDAGRIYGELAKILGKNVDQVQKLKQAGKIKAGDAIEAVMRAVNQTAGGGDPGALAAKRARTTLSGTIDTIKSRWDSLIMDVDVGAAGGGTLSFLGEVAGMLDTTTARGARLKGALDTLFGSVGGAIAQILGANGGDFLDAIVGGVQTFADIVAAAMPGVVAFFEGFMGAVLGAKPGVASLADSLREWVATIFGNKDALQTLGRTLAQDFADGVRSAASAARTAITVLRALAPVFQLLSTMANAFSAATTAIQGAVRGAITALEDLFVSIAGAGVGEVLGWASEIGTSIIEGIVSGITSGAASVAQAITDTASGAISAAKETLGIASPSKVFHDIGIQTVEGFARGVAANDSARSAVEALVEPPPAPSAAGGPGGASGVGALGFGGPLIGSITINGATDPEAVAREIAKLLEAAAVRDGLRGVA